jgi:Na+-transporting methylmalonyl-CoA/oxaloacetate decarboxylase gamma subunit
MAKKFLGLSMFLWVLILLVVLFFVYGMGRVSEGFAMKKRCDDPKTITKDNMKNCNPRNCVWKDNACYCC